MQNVTLIGRLGRDAKLCTTTNGENFVAFTMAVNSKVRGAEKTTWYDVTSFNPQHAGKMLDYLKKGSNVVVVGEQDLSVETGNDGKSYLRARVSADRITFTGSGNSNNTSDNTAQQETNGQPEPQIVTVNADAADDDIVVTRKSTKTPAPKVVTPTVNTTEDEDLPF